MKYLAAYLLIQAAGREEPSVRDITQVLEAVGTEVDEKRIELLLSSIKGKTIEELIAEGANKLAAIPAAGAAAPAAAGASGDAASAKEEEKEESEEEEEDDVDMGMGLFD